MKDISVDYIREAFLICFSVMENDLSPEVIKIKKKLVCLMFEYEEGTDYMPQFEKSTCFGLPPLILQFNNPTPKRIETMLVLYKNMISTIRVADILFPTENFELAVHIIHQSDLLLDGFLFEDKSKYVPGIT
jgi:hypothetical protein